MIYSNTPEVKEIAGKAFPEYTGKRFKVAPFNGKMSLTSYWSGGSRNYWSLVNASTGKTFSVPENGTPWKPKTFEIGRLPMNIFLVCYHRGPYEDITVYVNPDNLNRLALPPAPELTRNEKIVLIATRSLKSSYAGIKEYRFHEANNCTKISFEDWNATKATCQSKGFLNKAGAITDAGRNAIGFKLAFVSNLSDKKNMKTILNCAGILVVFFVFGVAMAIESTRLPDFTIKEQTNYDNFRMILRQTRQLQSKIANQTIAIQNW